jgi:glycogen synthase kinase 3 beta
MAGLQTSLARAKETPSKGESALYTAESLIETGTFGAVYRGIVRETGQEVAIKRITVEKRGRNRELAILRTISHPNIVGLIDAFYTKGLREDEVRLNLVLEYLPQTLEHIATHYSRRNFPIPLLYVKLYAYQLFRGLGYLHINGICHRDIKPANLLIDTKTHRLVLTDLGSAKHISPDEPSASYIGARHYRAPELLFGATRYSEAVDLWSAGCVLAELLLGRPLFEGKTALEQLVEVIKVLGTPNKSQVTSMNPTQGEFRFPALPKKPWDIVLRPGTPAEAADLLDKLLVYVPSDRLTAYQALKHVFFDELRVKTTHLFSGRELPLLFNWNDQEVEGMPDDILRDFTPD